MQRLEVEDQVEFADVLEQPVQCFHIYLYQIQQCKWRLGRSTDHDEVQRGIVPVRYERRRIVVGRAVGARGGRKKRRQGEEVAATSWTGGNEGEDLGEESLLDCGVLASIRLAFGMVCEAGRSMYKLCVEFGQARLAIVVEHQHGVDHLGASCGSERGSCGSAGSGSSAARVTCERTAADSQWSPIEAANKTGAATALSPVSLRLSAQLQLHVARFRRPYDQPSQRKKPQQCLMEARATRTTVIAGLPQLIVNTGEQ